MALEGHKAITFSRVDCLHLKGFRKLKHADQSLTQTQKESNSDNVLQPVRRYLKCIVLGLDHLNTYIADINNLHIKEAWTFAETQHLVKALDWHINGPFQQTLDWTKATVFQNFRIRLSPEMVYARSKDKKG